MKVKTIKKFLDKETKKLHNVGDEFTVTEERYAEICKVGAFVVPVETAAKTTKAKTKTAKAAE